MAELSPTGELDLGFELPTRVVFRPGALGRLGDMALELGAARALLVTDPGVSRAGHPRRAQELLVAAGLRVAVHDQVREDPTTLDVERCVEVARAFEPDLLVAVGGGSSIDTAKGANFLLTNGGVMADYRGRNKATRPMLPMIAVPTTAGTGSEVQSFALIADETTHAKMACGDPGAAPRFALLDPELSATQPRAVTACTGLDAIAHAVETAVTRPRNDRSGPLSLRSFALAAEHLPRVLSDPEDLRARGAMLHAACLAGAAIEQSMLGAAHSLANPLSARFGIPHGQAVGTMLPHVVRFNAGDPDAAAIYAELAAVAGIAPRGTPPAEAARALAERLDALIQLAGLPAQLSACGVAAADLDALAAEAAEQWTAQFNPRPVAAAELRGLYATAL